MIHTSQSIDSVIEHFSRLPGIGKKTAQRLALFILKLPHDEVVRFAEALVALKEKVTYCSQCFNITEEDPCVICRNHKRDRSMVCVVEEPKDVLAIERTNEFHGIYHVLGGALSPLDGIGPDDIKIKELIERIQQSTAPSQQPIEEIIFALDPNVEGEATTVYLGKILKPACGDRIKMTRIARGLPIGSDLEFADQATLARAFEGRVTL